MFKKIMFIVLLICSTSLYAKVLEPEFLDIRFEITNKQQVAKIDASLEYKNTGKLIAYYKGANQYNEVKTIYVFENKIVIKDNGYTNELS